jgi:hypothetical protein
MVTIVRHMIDDLSATPTYSDSRLETLILISALQVKEDIENFAQVYTIDIEAVTLSPDPTNTATRDDSFIALVTLKAACTLCINAFKEAAGQSIRIKEGRSEIDFRDSAGHRKDLVEGEQSYCSMYQRAVSNYLRNSSGGVGHAILGPFAGEATQHRFGGYYFSPNYLRIERRI